VNIKYLLFLGMITAVADSHAGQNPAADAGALDPFAPISTWAVCPPPPDRDYDLQFSGNPEEAPTHLTGSRAERTEVGKLTLTGHAEAQRGYQRLRAERLVYSEAGATVEADGNVAYDEPSLNITGNKGKFWLNENRGELFGTHFHFYDRHGRGVARKAYIVRPGVTRFKKTMYTTCPESSNTWSLRATKVTLNKNTGVGVARNARLNIKDVPILYTPYLTFPIDDRRKTGFLTPSFGSSDNSGFEFKLPFYWNIAPNYDLLLTPRHLQDRGTQFTTEFRFLQHQQRGLVRVEYLNQDDITGNQRNRVIVRDKVRFSPNLTASIDYDRVSDKNYINDLGDSLSLASVTHLKRTGQVNYTTSWWNLGVQVDDYQTVDTTISQQNRPYQRLPRITFNADSPLRPLGLESRLATEAVRFDSGQRVTGDRLDLQPSISWPYRSRAFESTPKFGVRYTGYRLDNQGGGQPKRPNRTLPFFSLDNTVYFERNLSIAGHRYTHTLEPRLFYLYVRGENQQNLPLFDASEPTFTYRELFKENRFNGVDRVGDANQAALALTTRLIDPDNGAERLHASVGQLFFFANRNVTLNNTAPQTRSTSNIAAEIEMALSRAWSGKADMVWDPHDNSTQRANARIQYHPGFRKIANISYRFQNGSQNQIDISGLWPLSPSWQILGRWYYDISDSRKLESLVGIEYDSCCWGVRFITRDFIDSTNDNTNNTSNRIFMVQIVLKGLAAFGSNIESVLEDGILGYSKRPQD